MTGFLISISISGTSTAFSDLSLLLESDFDPSDFLCSGNVGLGSSGFLISRPISGTSFFLSLSLPLLLLCEDLDLLLCEDLDLLSLDFFLSGKSGLGSSGFLISISTSGVSIGFSLSSLLCDDLLLDFFSGNVTSGSSGFLISIPMSGRSFFLGFSSSLPLSLSEDLDLLEW